jgi:hypothetical protein
MPTTANKKTFTAPLVTGDGDGSWTRVVIPFDVKEVWGSGSYVQVKGAIDGYVFEKVKLMPSGGGKHFLAVNEKIRKTIGKGTGDMVKVVLEQDFQSDAPPATPDDFLKALAANPSAKKFYEGLTPAAQKWFILSITEAKQPATRVTRIQKAIERLNAGKKFHD